MNSSKEGSNSLSNVKPYIVSVLYLLFVIQIGLLSIVPESNILYKFIQYYDDAIECFAVVIVAVAVITKRKSFSKIEYAIMASAALFAVIGFVSSLVYRYQTFFDSITDMMVCIRFVILYLATRVVLANAEENKKTMSCIAPACAVLIAMFAIICLHELTAKIPFFERYDYRYFTYSMKLFFGTQSEFGACMFCLAIPLVLFAGINPDRKYITAFIIVGFFLAVLCQRAKTIAAAVFALAAFLLFCILKVKSNWKVNSAAGLLTVAGAYAFGRDRIAAFYLNKKMARGMMLRDSITLANEYFPLGTGFGTFGTTTALKKWSPLYERFGYPYGIEVYDVFWPGVFAQTGWVGTAAFLFVVFCMIFMAIRLQKKNPYLFVTAISAVFCLLCSSTGEAAFFHPMYNSLFVLLAICVNMYSYENE